MERIVMETPTVQEDKRRDAMARMAGGIFIYFLDLGAFLYLVRNITMLYNRFYIQDMDFFYSIQGAALFLHILSAIFIIREIAQAYESLREG